MWVQRTLWSTDEQCSLTVSDSAAGPAAFTLNEEKGVARVRGRKRVSMLFISSGTYGVGSR